MGPSHQPKHSDVIVVESAGIWFVIPTSDRAERWLKEHVSLEAPRLGDALMLEGRYAAAVVAGLREHGLVVWHGGVAQ
jgi:hypothetical protein